MIFQVLGEETLWFRIDELTGNIYTRLSLNLEAGGGRRLYSFVVIGCDSGVPTLQTMAKVVVIVTPDNRYAPEVSIILKDDLRRATLRDYYAARSAWMLSLSTPPPQGVPSSVQEMSVVATVLVFDPDSENVVVQIENHDDFENWTFELLRQPKGSANIHTFLLSVKSTTSQLHLFSETLITLSIVASDSGLPQLEARRNVTVDIGSFVQLNHPDVRFNRRTYYATLQDTDRVGTTVVSVNMEDGEKDRNREGGDDQGGVDTYQETWSNVGKTKPRREYDDGIRSLTERLFLYELTGNHTDVFQIDVSTGMITTLDMLRCRAPRIYNLTVTVQSAGWVSAVHCTATVLVRVRPASRRHPPKFDTLFQLIELPPEALELVQQVRIFSGNITFILTILFIYFCRFCIHNRQSLAGFV